MCVVYGRTALRGPVGGDAGELQYAGPLLALVHPIGQPLYVTLGYLWSHLVPIGSFAYRMNLLAAVSGAATCAVLVWTIGRVHGNLLVASAAGLTLGLGATFWGQAVIADKYAFTAFLAALIVGLAMTWDAARQHANADYRLYALSLALGMGFLHHRSLFLFVPGLVLLIAIREQNTLWRNWRRTAKCVAFVLLPPLIIYPLFLPWVQSRHLSPILWQPTTVPDWINWGLERHVIFGEALEFGSTGSVLNRLAIYWRTILRDYTLLVVLVSAFGFGVIGRNQPVRLTFLLLTFLLTGGLAANFRGNERQFTYYLPSFVILIYVYAVGLTALWEKARSLFRGWPRGLAIVRIIGISLALLIPLIQFRQTYTLRWHEATYGEPLDIWRQTLKTGNLGERLAAGLEDLPANAVVIGDWEQITILWYYQKVEKRRPDLTLVYPIERLTDYVASDRDVIIARHVPVGTEWHPTNIGALVHLQRHPSYTISERMSSVGILLHNSENEPRLELVGYSMDDGPYVKGTYVPLLLTWRALTDLAEDYAISLRILDENRRQLWSKDIASPVIGMYPTSRWVKDEMVQDYHELAIPPEMAPGRYLWTVVVYSQTANGEFIHLRNPQGETEILVGTFEVRAP
ncbi:MAG: glycosyltransferase family 117 protein [Anaerolineae bacterium]